MTEHSLTYGSEPGEVLARLRDLREFDAPTHGGRVLAYAERRLPALTRLRNQKPCRSRASPPHLRAADALNFIGNVF